MAFQPEVSQPLAIGDKTYLVARHPVAPGMPYGQEGRQAVVYQLVAGADCRALKVFKPRFRVPTLVTLADRLAGFGKLPGLAVCLRTVFTARRHTGLLQEYPDLIYGVLMPWVDGPTWMEVLLEGEPLTQERSLTLAHALADVLSSMQEEGVAHCDLSGPNLILPLLSDSRATGSTAFPIQLVDVEQLFGPGLDRPKALPGGSPGYAHKSASEGLWEPNADRFAGAILIAEMLGMCDSRIVAANWGESYFDPTEMQQPCERFQLLSQVLAERWGGALAGLLERAWASETLDDCPTFGEWFVSLPENLAAASPRNSAQQEALATAPVAFDTGLLDATKVTVRELINQAEKYTSAGYLGSALALYREALSLAPPDGKLYSDIQARLTDVDVRILEGEEARFAPQEQDAPYPQPNFTSLAGNRSGTTPTTGPLNAGNLRPSDAEVMSQPVTTAPLVAKPQYPPTDGEWIDRTTISTVATDVPKGRAPIALFAGGTAAIILVILVVVLVALVLPDGAPLHTAFSGAAATGTPRTISSPVVAVIVNSPTALPTLPAPVEASPTATAPQVAATAAPTTSANTTGSTSGSPGTPTRPGLRVNSLAVSPDGSLVAAGTSNNTTQLVDVVAHKEIATLTGHTGWVTGVAFSPDGKTLATTSTDSTIRLWSIPDGAPSAVLRGHTDWVTAVAFTTDGKTLVSASNDGTVRAWILPDGNAKKTLNGPASGVIDIAISPDGALLASAYRDGTIWLWSTADLSPLYTLEGAKSVTTLAISKNNVVAAASGNEIYTWDARTRKRLANFVGHTNTVESVSFSQDGTVLASSAQDSTIKLWSVSNGKLLRSLDAGEPISSVLYLPGGQALVSGSQNGGLQFWGQLSKP